MVLRSEELASQRDMRRFLAVSASLSRKIEGAERMMSELQSPNKADAMGLRYFAARDLMPMTESHFREYCINQRTGKPYEGFQHRPVFPDSFTPMIETVNATLGARLDKIYGNGILPLLRKAGAAA